MTKLFIIRFPLALCRTLPMADHHKTMQLNLVLLHSVKKIQNPFGADSNGFRCHIFKVSHFSLLLSHSLRKNRLYLKKLQNITPLGCDAYNNILTPMVRNHNVHVDGSMVYFYRAK